MSDNTHDIYEDIPGSNVQSVDAQSVNNHILYDPVTEAAFEAFQLACEMGCTCQQLNDIMATAADMIEAYDNLTPIDAAEAAYDIIIPFDQDDYDSDYNSDPNNPVFHGQ